jgi:SAM-dependent methyltransferase
MPDSAGYDTGATHTGGMTAAAESDSEGFATRSRSFGKAASAYAAGRPSYPREAVEWLLNGVDGDVADVGAGTGKLTEIVAQVLEGSGARVTAVEPDPGMLEALAVPGVDKRLGSAEALPLDDASFGAVVFGQAWHWVDVPVASREAGRVLRPGGVLGLIWNVRDTAVPWVDELTRAMRGSDAEAMIEAGGPTVDSPFGALERRTFRWANPLTLDRLLQMAASRSYLITATEEHRQAVFADIRALAARAPEVAGRETFDMPYVTHAFRAVTPA